MLALGCLVTTAPASSTWGCRTISAGLERLILFSLSDVSILIGVLLGRSLHPAEAIAIALCYTGIGFAFLHDLQENLGDTRSVLIGGALVFASAACGTPSGDWKSYARLGAMRFAALAMLPSAVTLIHFWACSRSPPLSSRCPVYGWALAMALSPR